MNVYRKYGAVARYEDGVVIRVVERGIAIEQDELFECRPDDQAREEPSASFAESIDAVRNAAAAIREAIPAGVRIERLLLLDGEAQHQYGDRTWTERSRRLHLSLVRGPLRALIDLGSFELEDVVRSADALVRASRVEQNAPPLLRLAPGVTAALLPSLVGLAPPNVRLLQTAGGIDGRGGEIVEARMEWPNWYRPSYRVRPVRLPLNLRIESDVTEIDHERPLAVALLGPIDGLTMRVLIDDHASVYPATVRVTRIDAVGPVAGWYPYGAGSFGAEMML